MIKQIFHHYEKWECYKNGMWRKVPTEEQSNLLKQAIIKLLKRRYVSVWDAYEMVGCTKLPARVSELIEQGYHIDKKEMNVTTRFGAKVRIKKYRIISVPKDENKNLQNLQK